MKKLTAVVLTFLMLIVIGGSFMACGNRDKTVVNDGDDYIVATYYFPNWGSQNKDKVFNPSTDSEWGSIMNALPKFEGHQQPKVPVWGYEDAADPAVMAKKIEQARTNGIDTFIFDWYWFREIRAGGKATGLYLEAELERGFLKAENTNDLDFALMWCNHDVGTDLKANITPEEFDVMTDYIIENYFTKPNAFRVDGNLYFSIYQMDNFVDMFKNEFGMTDIKLAKAALENFRQKVRDAGLGELHLNCMVWGAKNIDATGAWPGGIPPLNFNAMDYLGVDSTTSYVWAHDVWPGSTLSVDYQPWSEKAVEKTAMMMNDTIDYDIPYYPNLTMGWDPSPRCDQTVEYDPNKGYPFTPIVYNNTPENFKNAALKIREIMDNAEMKNKILTVNSWNEWGEGSYLEPDDVNGYGYLWAIKEVFGTKHREI